MPLYDKDPTGHYDVLHDSRHTYRLLVIHQTNYKAERAVKELGLEGAYPAAVGDALSVRGFQKIVILCDLSKEHQGQQYLSYLATKLPPGGKIYDLS